MLMEQESLRLKNTYTDTGQKAFKRSTRPAPDSQPAMPAATARPAKQGGGVPPPAKARPCYAAIYLPHTTTWHSGKTPVCSRPLALASTHAAQSSWKPCRHDENESRRDQEKFMKCQPVLCRLRVSKRASYPSHGALDPATCCQYASFNVAFALHRIETEPVLQVQP